MLKLYLYPNARPHVHDSIPNYVNCVPLSKDGIVKHFELTDDAEGADFFYMGQFDDSIAHQTNGLQSHFEFFERYREKHICDIEGDWPRLPLPKWLEGSIITVNGLSRADSDIPAKYLVRPTFSSLLVYLAKIELREPQPAECHGYSFRGLPDPHGLRLKMKNAFDISGCDGEVIFNGSWNGPTPVVSKVISDYVDLIKKYSLGLCPRGNGKDSVRFFETCAYGRIPVVIGDNILFGEGYANLDFVEQLSETITIRNMATRLQVMESVYSEDAQYWGLQAYNYFKTYVVDYFKDPTSYFIRHCLEKK